MVQCFPRTYCCFIGALFLGLVPLASQAEDQIFVREVIKVYSRPSRQATVITKLASGERVSATTIADQAYLRVRVLRGSSPLTGYVAKGDLKKSVLKQGTYTSRFEEEKSRQWDEVYSGQWAFGVAWVYSQLQQGKRSLEGGDTVNYSVSELKSTTSYFEIFADMPLGPGWMFRPYLGLRQAQFEGESTDNTSANSEAVRLNQSFLGLGLEFKYYRLSTSSLWYCGGLELASGRAVDLTIGGVKQNLSSSDMPFFAFLNLGLGYDFHLWGRVYLSPQLRFGGAINTKPMIFETEGLVAFAYLLRSP